MKLGLLLFFLTLNSIASASIYYVATNGNDSNPGTFVLPWATWGKAFTSTNVLPGDTIYFRGGVYYKSTSEPSSNFGTGGYSICYALKRNGTSGNPIKYWNYPGETPILDCKNVIPIGNTLNAAIQGNDKSYLHFKGLTVRNVWQTPTGSAYGWYVNCDNNVKWENCTVYNVHGRGWRIMEGSAIEVINCDAHHCCDSLTTADPGNDGNGFLTGGLIQANHSITFTNCRAWLCGDQGFATNDSTGIVIFDGCWSFLHGSRGVYNRNGIEMTGDGHGIKLGHFFDNNGTTKLRKIVKNCVLAYNSYSGIVTNDEGRQMQGMQIYNNTIYKTGYPARFETAYGVWIYNTEDSDTDELARVFKNNISYGSQTGPIKFNAGAKATVEYNSWNTPPGVTISDIDFLSVDSTGITAPRQDDGSLPDNNCYKYFLRLAPASDLIDVGTNVGLPFVGMRPDLGFKEYSSGSPVYVNKAPMVNNIPNQTIAEGSTFTTINLDNYVFDSDNSDSEIIWRLTGNTQLTISIVNRVATINIPNTDWNGSEIITFRASDPGTLYGETTTVFTVTAVNDRPSFTKGPDQTVAQNSGSRSIINWATHISPGPSNEASQTALFTVTNTNSELFTTQPSISSTGTLMFTPASDASGNAIVTAYLKDNGGTNGGGVDQSINQTFNIIITASNIPPVVSISSPTKSISFTSPATITIDAIASDTDGTVTKVEFFNGSIKLGEKASPPYSVTWKDVLEGTYYITAAATDNKNDKTISPPVSIIVERPIGTVNQRPVVSIVSPEKNKKYKRNDKIIIEAIASDPDGIISKVVFKNDDVTIGEDSSAPYQYTIQNADTGRYSITATAIDNLGANSSSSPLELFVDVLDSQGQDIFIVYPNPTDGLFSIQLLSPIISEDCVISILTNAGNLLSKERWNPLQSIEHFDISNVTPGLYIILITSNNKVLAAEKIIKR